LRTNLLMLKPIPFKIPAKIRDELPSDQKREKIISLLKRKFNFEQAHLTSAPEVEGDILSKCFSYSAPEQARDLGIYPYFREIQQATGSHVVVDGRQIITVASNNYLGLAQNPSVVAAGKAALDRYGIGCTGSRFLNGTLDLHRELEKMLSNFLRREDAVVMSTGFQANQGTIACLLGRKDMAFSDRENHASIYEGCAVAPGKTMRYRHNDMEHLEYLLQKYSSVKGKLIITDSVFSMSGDIANLPAMVKLAKDYGATLLVDEAHGLGIMGDRGAGVANYYNVEDEIDIYMGTFSKSLGSIGGFISAKAGVVDYIRHKAAAFIFTAALPPASVAGVLTALDILIQEPERRNRLQENTEYVKRGFFDMGVQVNNNKVPIIPVRIGDEALTLYLNRLLFDDGIFTGVAVSPVVPTHNAMVRASLTSEHTREDLDTVLGAFRKYGDQLGIFQQ